MELANELVKHLPRRKYESIVDICCGTWNLLAAAKKEYPHAKIYGVDIDENISNYTLGDANFALDDGRSFAEKEKEANRTYDLILSNPPFGRLLDDEVYWKQESDNENFSALKCRRYELEMMLANIYLAHEGSMLLFILPITFIKGETFKKARKQIAKEFAIYEIIELPINTFERGRISTAAVIMEKKVNSRKDISIHRASFRNLIWEFEAISVQKSREVKKGNWIRTVTSESSINIRRGTVHSGKMCGGQNIVLHCSSNYDEKKWEPSLRYTEQIDGICAESGDILVNRVGKGAGYWCINTMDNVQISDCLFVIKNDGEGLLKKLCDNTVEGRLNIEMRGVSTFYITKSDILKLLA